MSTHQWEELNIFEGSTYSCSCLMWKLASCAMVAKVSWIASWVHVHLLSWAQHKKWIPIRLMRCVHMHWGILTIEGWGNLSRIQSNVEKIREDSQKLGKISQIISQTLGLGLEHDRIQTRWALDIMLESMLEKVWWCRCSEMDSWSWTICCLMSCSYERKHVRTRGDRRSHGALRCCWKVRCYCRLMLRLQEEKDVDQP
jgi:hypothetical protein